MPVGEIQAPLQTPSDQEAPPALKSFCFDREKSLGKSLGREHADSSYWRKSKQGSEAPTWQRVWMVFEADHLMVTCNQVHLEHQGRGICDTEIGLSDSHE